jgi:AbrB family looped-hinge helix DNA binding protein
MASVVSKKGWVVIPREIRERFGIKPGAKVEFVTIAGSIRLVPLSDDPIAASRGMLKGGPSWEELLAEKQRELDEEERGLPPPRPSR